MNLREYVDEITARRRAKEAPVVMGEMHDNDKAGNGHDHYVVLRREDWLAAGGEAAPLEDATVIRAQDHLALPTLWAYAHSAATALQAIETVTDIFLDEELTWDERWGKVTGLVTQLRESADYFAERAFQAQRYGSKFPDH